MTSPPELRDRVLLLTPTGRDSHLALEALAAEGIRAEACHDVAALCEGVVAGAALAVVAEEAMRTEGVSRLLAVLAQQPAWSDLPIILLGDPDSQRRREQRLLENANVTLLERPFRMRTLLAAVKAAQRARARQYEAQRAIEERDMFLAMLGHELRNPLSAIRFALHALEAPGRTQAQAAASRDLVARQTQRLTRLVDDLLDVSRVTSGKIQVRTGPVELRGLVQRVVDAMQPAAADVGVELAFSATSDELRLQADAVRLEQVFTNLVNNALKFTPAGGRVDVRADRLGPHAIVAVRDTGVGIPPDSLERIFQVFAQVQTTLDRSRGGLGLGLTLAKSLAELHGGTIQAASAGVGTGAEFRVTLPLDMAPVIHPATVAPEAAGRARSQKVVVVEDNEDLRDAFRDVLAEQGHDVHVARDGGAGVQAILSHRPDVAFVDIGLPVLDGYEVARQVRQRLGSSVRLVALTGYGQPADKSRAHAVGFDLHLTKPVDPVLLERLLDDDGQAGLAQPIAIKPSR